MQMDHRDTSRSYHEARNPYKRTTRATQRGSLNQKQRNAKISTKSNGDFAPTDSHGAHADITRRVGQGGSGLRASDGVEAPENR